MKIPTNKTYIHYFKIKENGTKEYLYSVPNKQHRSKYGFHEELEHVTKIRIEKKIGEMEL